MTSHDEGSASRQFCAASELMNDARVKQVNTLLYCVGEEVKAVLISANATEEEQSKVRCILQSVEQCHL